MRALAADYINDLIHPFPTAAPVDRVFIRTLRSSPGIYALTPPVRINTYRHMHPALLDQLEETETTSTTGGEIVRSAPASRPAGRLDVLAFLDRIQSQSLELATEHDIELMPLRLRLGKLAGALLATDGEALHVVKGWWVTARVLTSFDSAAFTPNVPCPNEACERRGALRVKVSESGHDNMAVCVECHQVWDGPNFGVFAMWVQWASEHLRSAHCCDECETTHLAMLERAEQRRRRTPSATQKSRYASSRR